MSCHEQLLRSGRRLAQHISIWRLPSARAFTGLPETAFFAAADSRGSPQIQGRGAVGLKWYGLDAAVSGDDSVYTKVESHTRVFSNRQTGALSRLRWCWWQLLPGVIHGFWGQ